MTVEELILIKSDKVRRSPSLMAFYIESFENTFGFKPNCAGCTFDTDFSKLIQAVKGEINVIKTINIMGSFKLKVLEDTILFYNDEQGRTVRKYDNRITNDFVLGFLTSGTAEQIEERKKLL